MGKRIESSELVGNDVLKNLRESVVSTENKTNALAIQLNVVNDLLISIKKNASTIKSGVLDLGKTTTSDLSARSQAQKVSNQLAKDSILLQKEEARLNAELIKNKKLEEQLKQAELRTQKQINGESKKTLTSYQLQSRALNEMRDRYKDLAVQKMNGIKLTKEEAREFRSLIPQIRQTDAALKKIDAIGGQFNRNVGNYPKAINGFKNALGQLGVSFGVFQLANSAGKSLIGFENSLASFRTIVSDLNDNQFEKYKTQIKSVADETKRTNTEIADSFNAIAGLNSKFAETSDGLGEVSKAVTTLSDASKDDLKTSAESLVGIMNQFDLAANQADRTINVLAAGQAVGASSITQSAEAYKNFGAVAKGANITLEQSQALIQVLGKNSIFGAEAGTKLRGVTLQLQKAKLGYASGQFNINDALEEFNAKMAKKTTASAKDAYATKIFGADNITAGKIVSNNIPLFNEYTKAVTGTTEAQKAAAINNDTLSKKWEQFKNVLENSITSSTSTNGILDTLKDTLGFLSKNMDVVLSAVKKGVAAWITYKVAIKSMKLYESISDWKKLGGNIVDTTGNLKDGAESAKSFGNALKGIGFTAIIALLAEVAMEFKHVASGALVAEQRIKAINELTAKGAKEGKEYSDTFSKSLEKRFKQIELMNVSENEQNRLRKKAVEENKLSIKQKIAEAKENHKIIDSQRRLAISERDRIKETRKGAGWVQIAMKDQQILFGNAENAVTKLTADEKYWLEIVNALESNLIGLGDETHNLNVEQKNLGTTTEDNGKKVKELNTQLEAQNRYLSEQIELVDQLNNLTRSNEISSVQKQADEELQKQIDSALTTGSFDNLLTNYKEFIRVRTDIAIQGTKAEEQYKLEELQRGIDEAQRLELENITNNRDKLLAQEGLTANQKAIIQKQYEDQLVKLEQDRIARQEYFDKKQILITDETTKKQAEIVKQGEDDIIEAKAKTLAAQNEFLTEQGTATDTDTKARLKKRYEEMQKYEELFTQFLQDQIDKRIAQVEKESEAHKKQYDYFQELSKSGNINAEQSLAREAELQRAADAEKAKLEKQKQWLAVASAFLASYNSRLADGQKSGQALAGAIADKAVLEAIVKTIPAFKEGGEHDGGLMIVNDAHGSNFREIIQTPDGKTFSPEGRNVIMDAPKGTLIHTPDQWDNINSKMQSKDAFRNANSLGGNVAGNSFDIAPLVKGFKSLEKAIKDKPETIYKAEEFVSGVLTVSKYEKRKNIITRTETQFRPK